MQLSRTSAAQVLRWRLSPHCNPTFHLSAADLVREMQPVPSDLSLEFIRASSYGAGTESSGQVSLAGADGLAAMVGGKHVLVVRRTLVIFIFYLLPAYQCIHYATRLT